MKRLAVMFSLVLFAAFGCESATRSVKMQNSDSGVRDGSSYATAILIRARSQGDGIREEYAWLKTNFPTARPAEVEKAGEEEIVFGHHTDVHDGRFFSVHTLVLPDGKIRPVYFDVTSYFGKGR